MVYTYTSNVSWTKGPHQMRFGVELVDFQQNDWQPSITGGPRGLFTFDGAVTSLSGGASPSQYDAYAAFLLGLPQSVSKALQYYSPSNHVIGIQAVSKADARRQQPVAGCDSRIPWLAASPSDQDIVGGRILTVQAFAGTV